MHIKNEQVQQRQWLQHMFNDDYYPAFLVDKLVAILQGVCVRIETEAPQTLEELYRISDAAALQINALQDEFYAHDSELETIARDALAEEFKFIAQIYQFPAADIEEMIASRDW